jgi:uncharacterized membrane protein YkoI
MMIARRKIMRNTFANALGSVLTLLFWTGIASASEKRVNYEDLPPAVQKTAQRESQGATLRGYSKEIENGKIEYEVEMIVAGKSRDVSIDPSGKVIEVEQQVALDAVPAAAMAAILKEAKGDSIRKVEEVRSDAETAYEAQILRNGKHREVRVHADGSAAPEQD